ncbi:hypothetical protein RR42_m4045 [Cupriavidus basilensis]|uniref:Uncharacterized protein n=1 Tax=Cupriavidus basilensis TaxID=68895 RepID=A0A0C4YHJ5_9BURK|nr:hypothetical protein RR42_m4045 [Cupriavidus basilensis]
MENRESAPCGETDESNGSLKGFVAGSARRFFTSLVRGR